MAFASIVGAIAGALAGFLAAAYLHTFLLFRIAMPFGFSLLGGAVTLGAFYLYPQFTAVDGRKLDSQLSFTVGHMAVLARPA